MTTAPGTHILFITLEMPVTDQFYGMREFTIRDPDGYVVTFAQPNR